MRVWSWWRTINEHLNDGCITGYYRGFDADDIKAVRRYKFANGLGEVMLIRVMGVPISVEYNKRVNGNFYTIVSDGVYERMMILDNTRDVAKTLIVMCITLKYL